MPDTVQLLTARQVITFIIGSVVVIFGAYFITYLLARGSQRMHKGRAIQVLDRFSLAKDKSIVVLSVYDKTYLVAFSAGAVAVLDKLDAEAVAQINADDAPAPYSGAHNPAAAFYRLLQKLPLQKKSSKKDGIPFELYLQQEQASREQQTPGSHDNLDAVYDRIKNRKGKEDQYSAFSDTTFFKEDIHK